MQDNRTILTISELNAEANLLLKRGFPLVWLEGEISNFSKPASGHFYFSLKDKQAQVRCAMFKTHNRRLLMKPENGQQVLARGRIALYEPRGEFQVIVEHMEDAGEGLLQKQYQALKQKLSEEGLFEDARKKAFPIYPKKIAIMTSSTGAAVQDIVNVLQRRCPHIPLQLYPVSVQGDAAVSEILAALQQSEEDQACDVLILARGGGSIEDLQAFNNEQIARRIANHRLPIITGIGHEIDFTIADFVADMRAPTPSAAAELISPNRDELLQTLDQFDGRLNRAIDQQINTKRQKIDWLNKRLSQQHPSQQLILQTQKLNTHRLSLTKQINTHLNQLSNRVSQYNIRLMASSPQVKLQQNRLELEHSIENLQRSIQNKQDTAEQQLAQIVAHLNAISPLSTLERGYSITRNVNKQPISSVTQLKHGDLLETYMKDGVIRSTVVDRILRNL